MTRQPVALHARLASTIAGHVKTLALHTQQIVTLQSQSTMVAALVPGDWEAITLTGGWTNVGGAVPAQARLITSTTVQIIGNIHGGTTTNGTTIGTLTAGFFNTVHGHTFDAVAVTGAAAVSVAGDVSGSVDDSGLDDGSIQGFSDTAHLPDGTTEGNSASASGSGSHSHGAGSYTLTNGAHWHGGGSLDGSLAVTNGHHQHGSSAMAAATPVNYNKPSITLGTDGTLKINNVNSAVTQLSFHEASLPLFTA